MLRTSLPTWRSAMTFKRGVSGNPHGNRHRTRHLLNQEFMQALLLHFRQHGKKAIEKVAREQPASYLKILGLLVPREHKVEHTNPLKKLTDEQLEAMIEYLETSLAAQAGAPAKMIEGTIEPISVELQRGPARFSQTQEQSDAGGRHCGRPEGAHATQGQTTTGLVI